MRGHHANVRVIEALAIRRYGKAGSVIDSNWVIGDDEFSCRLGGGSDLPNALRPDCAM